MANIESVKDTKNNCVKLWHELIQRNNRTKTGNNL